MLLFPSNIFFSRKPDPAALKQCAHDFSFVSLKDGAPLPLAQFAGRALLVVNTASKCMFTPQYAQLQELWQRHRQHGLVMIGVPSNDFGKQEPGTAKEIKQFCKKEYAVTFPMTEKETVRGPYAHPFYLWAEKIAGRAAAPRWNFHKYLIAPDGRLVDFFLPFTSPLAKRVRGAVERVLPG